MKKEYLAPIQVSREWKGRVKAFAFDRGVSLSALVVQAVNELMERAEKGKEEGK